MLNESHFPSWNWEEDDDPNNWDWVRTSLLMPDGSWATEDKTKQIDLIEIKRLNQQWYEKHHYLYITRHGNNQSCMAQIRVEEREWVHKPTGNRKIKRDIDVQFENELGTQAGSWKGGVVGCSFEMLPNETPLETLRRMELTRTFR